MSRGLGAGLLALAPGWRTRAAEAPFALGLASGSPEPDGFVIWTRLTADPLAPDGRGGLAGPLPVRWEVAEDEPMRRIVASGEQVAGPDFAHSVHVEVGGLQPGRPYWYRFAALGQQSPVGRTRTAPEPRSSPGRMKIVASCCAHYEVGWFGAYRHMMDENPDLVLLLGDYIYEYSYGANRTDLVRRHAVPGEVRDLAGYRNRYAQHRLDPDLAALHASAPCLVTWDDHEVQNDYGGDFSQIGTVPPEEFALRRRAAYQAFYEHMPLRASASPRAVDGSLQLHGRHRFGQLAELTLFDVRQHRSVQICTRGNNRRAYVVSAAACPELEDPSRTMLGQTQEAWLQAALRGEGARWNILANGLMISPYVQRAADGSLGAYTDGWSAFAAARRRLLETLKGSGRENLVSLAGDLHAFVAADLGADPDDPESAALAAEFVASSVTSDLMNDSFGQTLDLNPHVRLFENRHNGYLSLDLTPARLEVAMRGVSSRADRAATVSTLRRFAVENGRPGIAGQ